MSKSLFSRVAVSALLALTAALALRSMRPSAGEAAAPGNGALGCTMSNDAHTLTFPATRYGPWWNPGPLYLTGSDPNPVPGAVPATLKPRSFVMCGALFQQADTGPFGPDPDVIDGGTITYWIAESTGVNVVILESNGATRSIPCGTSSAPAGVNSCQGALESNGTLAAPPGNAIHVGISGPAPTAPASFTICAEYMRYLSLGPAFVLNTNCQTVPVQWGPPNCSPRYGCP
jgi:hypothetical protein